MCIDRLTETEDIAGLMQSKAELQEVHRKEDRRIIRCSNGDARDAVTFSTANHSSYTVERLGDQAGSLGASQTALVYYVPWLRGGGGNGGFPSLYAAKNICMPDLPGHRRSRGDMYPEKSLSIPTMS